MANNTVELLIKLKNETGKSFDQIEKDLKSLTKKEDGLTDSVKKNTKANKENESALKKTKGEIGKLALAITAGVAAYAAMAKATVDANKELQRNSTLAGVSVESFQQLAFAGRQFGVTAEETASAVNDLSLKINEAAQLGSGAFIDVAKSLGISNDEVLRLSRLAPDEQMLAFADAVSKVDANLRRTAFDELASDPLILFGRALENGRAGLIAFGDEAKNLGLILSSSDVENIGRLGIELENTTSIIQTKFAKSLSDLTPILTELLEKTQEFAVESLTTENINSFINAASKLGDILAVVANIANVAAKTLGAIPETLALISNELRILDERTLKAQLNFFGPDTEKQLETAKQQLKDIDNLFAPIEKKNQLRREALEKINELTTQRQKELDRELAIEDSIKSLQEERVVLLQEGQKELDKLVDAKDKLFESGKNVLSVDKENNNELVKQRSNYDHIIERVNSLKNTVNQIRNANVAQNIPLSIPLQETIKTAEQQLLQLQGKTTEAQLAKLKQDFDKIQKEIAFKREAINEELLKDIITDDQKKAFEQQLKDLNLVESLFDAQKLKIGLDQTMQQISLLKESLGLVGTDQEATRGVISAELQNALDIATKLGDEGLIQNLKLQMQEFKEESLLTFDETAIALEAIGQSLDQNLGNNIIDALKGVQSFGDAVKNTMASVADAIAQAIVQALILRAINSAFGTTGTSISGAFTQAFAANHTGGKVGSGSGMTRNINPAAFIGAPKYHTGGIAGLKSNEIPTVLERGEEVLTTNDPRHVDNLNNSNAGGGALQPMIMQNNLAIGDDNINEMLNRESSVDTIIDIVNNNQDRITRV